VVGLAAISGLLSATRHTYQKVRGAARGILRGFICASVPARNMSGSPPPQPAPASAVPSSVSSLPSTAANAPWAAASNPSSSRARVLVTLGLAGLFLAWEAAGGDRWLADMAGNGSGFPLRSHWLLEAVLHGGARIVAWALALALCAGVWWPMGPLRLLSRAQRVQLAGGVLLSVAVVALLKAANPTACPWSLTAYGGVVEPVSHWAWWITPAGGRGSCFPAGHASAGFAFVGGWFVFREVAPLLARRWLLVALAAGLVLGLSQQWRGAHFMSHTLWSGWLCWCLAWALDSLRRRLAPASVVTAR
jgi:membrane-associated PAP2 superfamily phosphatase